MRRRRHTARWRARRSRGRRRMRNEFQAPEVRLTAPPAVGSTALRALMLLGLPTLAQGLKPPDHFFEIRLRLDSSRALSKRSNHWGPRQGARMGHPARTEAGPHMWSP